MTAVLMVEVVAVRPLSPNAVAFTFGGPGLERVCYDGADQRMKLLFARPGQPLPILPGEDDWYGDYLALPEEERPVMRTYTLRSQDPESGRIDVEFILHGATGPASAWALDAKPGDKVGIIASTVEDGGNARPYAPGDADWQLLVGDATALPAIASILEQLPETAVARVFIQVPSPDDERKLDTPADDVQITWLSEGSPAEAVRDAKLPDGVPYAWVAGEAAMVRSVRRHLVSERELRPRAHYFSGYWRRGVSEDAAEEDTE